MSKKAKASKKAAKPVAKKGGRKPEVIAMREDILKTAKAELAKDGQSKCEAVRKIAKRYGSARRIELEKVFVTGCRMNLGTVRRQIQEGRAA